MSDDRPTPPGDDGEQQAVSDAPRMLRGSCLCGAARYAVADAFEYAMYCHCSLCRRTTGSAFKAIGGIGRDGLTPPDDDTVLIYGGDPPHDIHCRHCGSFLYSVVREARYAHVALGTLHDDPTIRPTLHMCVASKAAWYDITDDLPQYEGLPHG